MDPVKEFINAAQKRRLCELKDTEGRVRTVEPYIVYTSSLGLRCFAVVQLSGYSSAPGDLPNWRNIPIQEIRSVKMLEETFEIRPDYNPGNKAVYFDVEFKI